MTVILAQDARLALGIAHPMIRELLSQDWIRRSDLHVIVSLRTSDGGYRILAEESFGEAEYWEHDYREIAIGKTKISARTGLSSREVQLMRPELLEEGDVMYWGSVIQGDVIVACSGVQSYFDEVAAKVVLAMCIALIQQNLEVLKTHATPTGDHYNS